MKRFLIVTVLAAALLLGACTPFGAASEPTQEKVSLPAVQSNPGDETPVGDAPADAYQAPEQAGSQGYPAPYDASTKTGIEPVDRVLTAVFTNNPADLTALLSFETAPCTTAEGLGGPPKCKEGEAENTQVEVLPSIGSEGSFTRRNELPEGFLSGPFTLRAVYEVKADVVQEDYYPAGKWGITLVKDGQTVTLRVADSGIVRVDYDTPGTEFRDAGNFILAAQ